MKSPSDSRAAAPPAVTGERDAAPTSPQLLAWREMHSRSLPDRDLWDSRIIALCDALLAARTALAEREAECARLRAVIANQLTQHMEASGEYSSAPTPGAET